MYTYIYERSMRCKRLTHETSAHTCATMRSCVHSSDIPCMQGMTWGGSHLISIAKLEINTLLDYQSRCSRN